MLVVTLFTPFYRVKIELTNPPDTTETFLYNFLYTYENAYNSTDNGINVWSYNSDTMGFLIILGLSWTACFLSCVVLALTALRANRGRILGMIVVGTLIIGFVSFMFLPFGFYPCSFTDFGSTASDKNPCNHIWGSQGNTSWGMYYGWYMMGIAAALSVAMVIVGVASPNPEEEEEYVPITNYGKDY